MAKDISFKSWSIMQPMDMKFIVELYWEKNIFNPNPKLAKLKAINTVIRRKLARFTRKQGKN